MKTSGTVSTRALAWKSRIVNLAMRIGRVASIRSESVTAPASSASAVLRILKVEPIS